jgi:hypothetical protein
MADKTLREEIAEKISERMHYGTVIKDFLPEDWQNDLKQAASIISLIEKRIEGIENPYCNREFSFMRQGFGEAIQKVKEVLK